MEQTRANETPASPTRFEREHVRGAVLDILDDLTGDWDMEYEGGIREETRLIEDLEFESIDVVQLVVAIEGHFKRRDLPFEKMLMNEGRYVDDLRVSDVVDFLQTHLNA